jgi:cation transport ATPase
MAEPDPTTAQSSESTDERLEREHEQLFHELRAIIPGAEVLFAFMLTVTFTQRFEQLTGVQRTVYYATLLCAGVALLLLLAPASFHRIRFRRHDKEAMMRIANVESIAALVLISLSVAGTIFLITDVMYSTEAAVAVGSAIWLCTGALWWGVPLRRNWDEHDAATRPRPRG